jgi:glycerate 2-kinase
MNRLDAKTALLDIYHAALAAVAPGPALRHALTQAPLSGADARVWVIALGKASRPMAEAAIETLASSRIVPAGGLVVGPAGHEPPHPNLAVVAGDHPEPGTASFRAAEALGQVTAQVQAGDTIWVLLSGGTTSLVGAPQPGIPPADLRQLYVALLDSGLDIKTMNLIRKRFTRWSGGRLARSLDRAGRIACYVISDVIGDDLAAIGSGPCVPDRSTAREVRDALVRARLWDRVAPSIREHLEAVETGAIAETPKEGDAAFDHVESHVIATNRVALDAAGRWAAALGLAVDLVEPAIVGEAAVAGANIGAAIVARARQSGSADPARCLIMGGETTVTIGTGAGVGGRCQELALAAARAMTGVALPVALLAAGTDGRDGPTDAAGAIVDATTWDRISAAGRDPARDLQRHDSYAALDAAGALVRTGPTETNVMDVVVGLS